MTNLPPASQSLPRAASLSAVGAFSHQLLSRAAYQKRARDRPRPSMHTLSLPPLRRQDCSLSPCMRCNGGLGRGSALSVGLTPQQAMCSLFGGPTPRINLASGPYGKGQKKLSEN